MTEPRTLTGHHDVATAASCPRDLSSAVSRFLQIPNGLDGAEHTRFRALVDSFFTPPRMAAVEPVLRGIATSIVASLPRDRSVDAVAGLGSPFAVRAACAWLGWPETTETELLQWMRVNHAATRSGELHRTAEAAACFDRIITSLTAVRREAGDAAPDDTTTELVGARVDGRPLADEEIVSILRNWTGGDLASMALCVGVIVRQLADHPQVQREVRARVGDAAALDRAIDELLRIDDPFVTSRRIATRQVSIGDQRIAAGERVVLDWTSANRDPARFGDPDAFRPEQNAEHNLVWGTGAHVCPGRPLATLELRILLQELLAATSWIEPAEVAEREEPPLGGYRTAPVILLG